jgi:hypothetical protein
MDLGSFAHSLQTWLGQVPIAAIGLALLAGPTTVLLVYRFVTMARRVQVASEVTLPTLWVCHSCRSVNELRASRCYRCGNERDAAGAIEIIVDRPEASPRLFEVPAGSPFAAVADAQPRQGVPVMDRSGTPGRSVPVGPRREAPIPSTVSKDGSVDLVEADR